MVVAAWVVMVVDIVVGVGKSPGEGREEAREGGGGRVLVFLVKSPTSPEVCIS